MVKDGKKVDSLSTNDKGEIILTNSPFYAESGGQVADTGTMFNENVNIEVTDVTKPIGKLFVHKVSISKGQVKIGDVLTASINTEKRNQTATHLLQKVLRSTLGNHVAQAGSLVCPDNLRFDFNHFKALTKEELKKIEKDVNEAIRQNYNVSITEMSIEQARKEGAMALFGEKYGDVVRTVKVIETDDKYFSMELCGGTHVQKTGDIGMFKIISESSVGSGIRRIEAVCGSACEKYVESLENKIDEIASILKTSKVMVVPAIEKMMQDTKNLETEISSLKSKLITGEIDEYIKSAKVINGVNVIAFAVEGVDVKTLREMADKVKEKQSSAIIVIASKLEDKVSFVISVSQDIVKQGYAAGKIAKQFASKIEGSGGGKPDFAQGGGKKTDNLKSVIENISDILK